MTPLLLSALALAAEQPVLPLEPRGKRPLAGLGLRSASQDHETVAAWWSRWPDANVGARCDGLVVLDVDGATGERSLADLERSLGPLPASRAVSTGRGQHVYFRCPTLAGNSTRGLGRPPGIDVRGGQRGYVVAPASVHASGRRYGWANERAIAPLPESWLERLTRARVGGPRAVETVHMLDLDSETPYGRRALERELERLYRARDGERNEVLNLVVFRLAQLVAGNQLPLARVEREALEVALLTGLDPAEIEKTIRSATSAGLRSPRSPSRVRASVNRG
jgi:Bifunctional DNA primase/polymerase, N-terminal